MLWYGAENAADDEPEQDRDDQRPHPKLRTRVRLVNSIEKSLDPNCYDKHDFGLVDDKKKAEVLTGYLGPKTNPKT